MSAGRRHFERTFAEGLTTNIGELQPLQPARSRIRRDLGCDAVTGGHGFASFEPGADLEQIGDDDGGETGIPTQIGCVLGRQQESMSLRRGSGGGRQRTLYRTQVTGETQFA